MDWWTADRVALLAQYMRLVVGAVLVIILIYMFMVDRVDLETVIKALIGLLAADKIGMGISQRR